jgi:lysophospholipase L1-like esterase
MNRFASVPTFALSFATLLAPYVAVSSLSGCSDDENGSSSTATGTATSTGTETGDTSPHSVGYDDENIVYSGRMLREPGKPPRFSAPAVTIMARFRGTGASMLLTDNSPSGIYFDVVIDGDFANSKKVRPDESGTTLLVENLPYGEHTLRLGRRNEASAGSVDFKGLVFAGELLPRPAPLTRKLEIIGDSISAGAGDEAINNSQACMDDYGRAVSNADKSWGPVLARTLNAEYHVTAVSGIGAIRNYSCKDPNTMPKVYDRVFVERADSPIYDTSEFVPDAVLVLLGTNDFSPDDCNNPPLNEASDPENYALFIDTMKDFVGTLRGYYPQAEIFLLSSPMLNDGWPSADYTSDSSQRAAITTVVDDLSPTDPKLRVVLADYDATRYAGKGCGSHPNLFEHAIIAGSDPGKPTDPAPAQLILNPVKEVMGW